jgi:hypothetical protein
MQTRSLTERRGSFDTRPLSRRFALEGASSGSCLPLSLAWRFLTTRRRQRATIGSGDARKGASAGSFGEKSYGGGRGTTSVKEGRRRWVRRRVEVAAAALAAAAESRFDNMAESV